MATPSTPLRAAMEIIDQSAASGHMTEGEHLEVGRALQQAHARAHPGPVGAKCILFTRGDRCEAFVVENDEQKVLVADLWSEDLADGSGPLLRYFLDPLLKVWATQTTMWSGQCFSLYKCPHFENQGVIGDGAGLTCFMSTPAEKVAFVNRILETPFWFGGDWNLRGDAHIIVTSVSRPSPESP